MNGNSLKNKANGSKIPAINPAQFPIGSVLSRAAARSMAQAREPSQDDYDAISLYRHIWLRADMTPNDRDLAATRPYARGKELTDQEGERDWPKTESHAALEFWALFGRLPNPGDILRFSQLQMVPAIKRRCQMDLIEAWGRQLPDLPCPLRFEGDKLLKRTVPTKAVGHSAAPNGPAEWVEYEEPTDSPEHDWLEIEREAGLLDDNSPTPRISAVLFRNAVHCRPATEREITEDQTEPSGGILGILVETVHRLKEEGILP